MLTIKNLSVTIDGKTILKNINFDFEEGKVYAILGPNGSGKSTLAMTIMGHPNYKLEDKSQIIFNNEDIGNQTSDKRAKKGIFLSFQTPPEIPGVKIHELLQAALQGVKDPLTIRQEIQKISNNLKIGEELLDRSINEGASGGERKKIELLQAALLGRRVQIFDEIDTGVDVDSLKLIIDYLQTNKKDKTYIFITHNNRIFRYLKPDKVIVLLNGEIKKTGDHKLLDKINKNGYAKL